MAWRRVQPTAAEPEGVNAERESHPQAHVSPHDAGLVAAALWSHPGEGGDRRPPRSSHGPTPCRRLSGRRPGRAASPGRDRPRQRPGLLYGRHSGFARCRPGSDGGRGVRPDRAVDRAAARADSGPHVSEGVGIPAASHPGVADPAPKNLADHARGRRELPGRPTEAPPGRGTCREHVFFVDAAPPRIRYVPASPVVDRAGVRPDVGVSTCRGLERRRPGTGGHHRRDGGERRNDVRFAADDRGPRTGGPVAPVLDDARRQRNVPVQGLAKGLRIARLFLPIVPAESGPDRDVRRLPSRP